MVLNSLERAITNSSSKYYTPIVHQLHWLPFKHTIELKTCFIVHNSVYLSLPCAHSSCQQILHLLIRLFLYLTPKSFGLLGVLSSWSTALEIYTPLCVL